MKKKYKFVREVTGGIVLKQRKYDNAHYVINLTLEVVSVKGIWEWPYGGMLAPLKNNEKTCCILNKQYMYEHFLYYYHPY